MLWIGKKYKFVFRISCMIMNAVDIMESVRKMFADYMDRNKFRKTPERFAILETVYSMPGHFNIEELYEKLLSDGHFRVSRATVYNTMELILDAGLVLRHQFSGTRVEYEKCFNVRPHNHKICIMCGEVSEFSNDGLDRTISEMRIPRFKQSMYSLYVYGLCSKCQTKIKRAKKQETKK